MFLKNSVIGAQEGIDNLRPETKARLNIYLEER